MFEFGKNCQFCAKVYSEIKEQLPAKYNSYSLSKWILIDDEYIIMDNVAL